MFHAPLSADLRWWASRTGRVCRSRVLRGRRSRCHPMKGQQGRRRRRGRRSPVAVRARFEGWRGRREPTRRGLPRSWPARHGRRCRSPRWQEPAGGSPCRHRAGGTVRRLSPTRRRRASGTSAGGRHAPRRRGRHRNGRSPGPDGACRTRRRAAMRWSGALSTASLPLSSGSTPVTALEPSSTRRHLGRTRRGRGACRGAVERRARAHVRFPSRCRTSSSASVPPTGTPRTPTLPFGRARPRGGGTGTWLRRGVRRTRGSPPPGVRWGWIRPPHLHR